MLDKAEHPLEVQVRVFDELGLLRVFDVPEGTPLRDNSHNKPPHPEPVKTLSPLTGTGFFRAQGNRCVGIAYHRRAAQPSLKPPPRGGPMPSAL